jgi:SAM-dependent methyltransferase
MQHKPTGERVYKELYKSSPANYLIYLFHKVTYNFASEYVKDKYVLDYGCGSGYGTHYIASFCKSIVGVDIAADAIEYAQSRYQAPNLVFAQIEAADKAIPLPYPDSSFDTVLSFQVIEHIVDPRPYLYEIKRVLKPSGVFICATPDRRSRLLAFQKPWNMWHVREYDPAGLKALLADYFETIDLLQMGGKKEVLALELQRTRRLAWLTLGVTLPFIPEVIRIAALRLLKRFAEQASRSRFLRSVPMRDFSFNESDLKIASDIMPSVNLIAVARKL